MDASHTTTATETGVPSTVIRLSTLTVIRVSVVCVVSNESNQMFVFDYDTLDVGGTTETATTTTDGRLLLPIYSAGEVAVIDTATHEELARFSGVGTYPWSVTTAEGQNYCR